MTFETLEHLILFVLDIRLWSGRKALKEEDLAAGGMDVRQLPPNSLVRIPAESDHDSDRKATTVPAGKRPAFRFDSDHHSGAIRPVLFESVVAG